jgi:uncharacterized membrane protein YdbT with pleckstrin-like domain
MSFPKSLLAEHEEVIFDLKPHWIALVPSVIWSIVLAAGAILAAIFLYDENGSYDWWEMLISAGFVLAWFFLSVLPYLRWNFTLFVLTTDRLITRHGIIAKHSKEIPLERINDVAFSQSVMERFLGAGDLMVESAGERGQTRIGNVRKPEDVQLMIYKETEKNSDRMLRPRGAAPAAVAASIPDQIEALARLRKQGVLSEDEFQAKKQQLLDRM